MSAPPAIIGVDPGKTTGCVVATDWSRRAGRHPLWLPGVVEVLQIAGNRHWMDRVEAIRAAAWELKATGRDVQVAVEDAPAGQAFLGGTIQMIGALRYAVWKEGVPGGLASAQTVRSWLNGGQRVPKNKGRSVVDNLLMAFYGGREAAVGGSKCSTCGGRGRRGRALKVRPSSVWVIDHEGRTYLSCTACEGRGHQPKGPLCGLWRPVSVRHHRDALAVAIYGGNNQDIFED